MRNYTVCCYYEHMLCERHKVQAKNKNEAESKVKAMLAYECCITGTKTITCFKAFPTK